MNSASASRRSAGAAHSSDCTAAGRRNSSRRASTSRHARSRLAPEDPLVDRHCAERLGPARLARRLGRPLYAGPPPQGDPYRAAVAGGLCLRDASADRPRFGACRASRAKLRSAGTRGIDPRGIALDQRARTRLAARSSRRFAGGSTRLARGRQGRAAGNRRQSDQCGRRGARAAPLSSHCHRPGAASVRQDGA